jgi:alginate O-acetyltransferase complex protein AlgI
VTSGLIHELVISFPAGAGYGLPTGYFTLQGLGVVLECSKVGQRFGLSRGFSGRLFTLVLTVAPAFRLFHPPFVERVILPFMHAVGAL